MIRNKFCKLYFFLHLCLRYWMLVVEAQVNGWNIERPTTTTLDENGQFKLHIDYSIGTAASNAVATLYKLDCLEPVSLGDNLVTVEPSVLVPGEGIFSLSVIVDKLSIPTSSLNQMEEGAGNSAGTISFCIRTDIFNEDLSVSFQRENFILSFDLRQNIFSFAQAPIRSDINDKVNNVRNNYRVIACQCGINASSFRDCLASLQSIKPGEMIGLCIYPNSTQVLISNFDMRFKKIKRNSSNQEFAQKEMPIVSKGNGRPKLSQRNKFKCLTNNGKGKGQNNRKLTVSKNPDKNQLKQELISEPLPSGYSFPRELQQDSFLPTLTPTFYPTTAYPTAENTRSLFFMNDEDMWWYEPWGYCYVYLHQTGFIQQIWIVNYSNENENHMKILGRKRSNIFLQGIPGIKVLWKGNRRDKRYATMLDNETIMIKDASGVITYMYRSNANNPNRPPTMSPTRCPEQLTRRLQLSTIMGNGRNYKVVSHVVTEFFQDGADGLDVTGQAYLVFTDSTRRKERILANVEPFVGDSKMRELDEELVGADVPFTLSIPLGGEQTSLRSVTKQFSSSLITIGILTLSVILMIVYFKKKNSHWTHFRNR